jgi:hypothetical protein
MSTAKSPSVSRSRSRVPSPPHERRVTIFERKEIIEGLSPVVIAAIQRELVEMRHEFEDRLDDSERKGDRRMGEVLQMASSERLDLEKMRLDRGQQWEDGSASASVTAK